MDMQRRRRSKEVLGRLKLVESIQAKEEVLNHHLKGLCQYRALAPLS